MLLLLLFHIINNIYTIHNILVKNTVLAYKANITTVIIEYQKKAKFQLV